MSGDPKQTPAPVEAGSVVEWLERSADAADARLETSIRDGSDEAPVGEPDAEDVIPSTARLPVESVPTGAADPEADAAADAVKPK